MEAKPHLRYAHRRQAGDSIDLLNPNISLGTCYFGPGQQAASNFIPCGNYAYDTYSCCQAGDNCLASNACFNYRGGVTYIAGCTDSTYNSTKCPKKGSFASQQWSGLVLCDQKAGTWTNCKEADGATNVQDPNRQCNCDGKQPLFTNSATLKQVAGLPLGLSSSISWVSGSTPTATSPTVTPSASSAPTSATSASTNGGSSSAMSSAMSSNTSVTAPAQTASDGSGSGLSQGATIGIGVGCGVGALLLIAVGVIAWMLRRRRRADEHRSVKSSPGGRGSGEMSSLPDRPVSTWQGSNAGGAGAMDSPVMSGFKSELPAHDLPRPPPAELDSTATPDPSLSPSVGGARTVSPTTTMAHNHTGTTYGGENGAAKNTIQGPIAELE
ncbi:hypothetical protein Micbo1qcDRAFT_225662 [Microdochium bolleyi]|uniref:Uncharacterized protein n=1 Tax=Microdochium bolleyi TaxID=196109 RepID=A0A136J0R0_9PEZI|nr:hypothetical protein Micbo1qcDRAFT_225662 [Microdochium bolleyi]